MQKIIENAINGDKQAEDELFRYLHVRFELFAKFKIGENDARDIAQEACLTVLQKYRFREDLSDFEGWAYMILRNKIGNYLKKKNLRQKYSNYLHFDDEDYSRNYTHNHEVREILIGCIKRLFNYYPRYARVLNLVQQGYDPAEICDKLKITKNNFYVLLNRSRRKLAQCLEGGDFK